MTKELIEELRGEADKLEGYVSATTMSGSVWVTHTGMAIRAMRRVADDLAARQPAVIDRDVAIDSIAGGTISVPGGYGVLHGDDAANIVDAIIEHAAVPDAATEFTSEGSGLFGVLGYSDDDPEVIKARAEAERDAALAALGRVQALTEAWRYGMPEYTSSTYQEGQKDQQRKLVGQLLAALDGAPEPEWEYTDSEGDPGPHHLTRFSTDLGTLARRNENRERMGHGPLQVYRRRKAGPWFPVEGESK